MVFRRPAPRPPEKPKLTLKDHAANIEKVLEALKVPPEGARRRYEVDQDYMWEFRRGSAIIQLQIFRDEGREYFKVLSPLLILPTSNLLPLYRRLLETNLRLTHAALGVYQDTVYMFSERLLDGMDSEEALHMIDMISQYADNLDNQLVNEFGGRLFGQI